MRNLRKTVYTSVFLMKGTKIVNGTSSVLVHFIEVSELMKDCVLCGDDQNHLKELTLYTDDDYLILEC